MQVFFIRSNGKKTAHFSHHGSLILGGVLGLASMFYAGIQYAQYIQGNTLSVSGVKHFRAELQDQQETLGGLQQEAQNHLDALTLNLGQLQSQMIRLNVVGRRIANKAGIDANEFNFSELPAVGGLESGSVVQSHDFEKLMTDIQSFSAQLEQRELQMDVLDAFYTHRSVDQEFMPTGKPVNSGWLSSKYGWRTDPFSGRRAFHHGIDFAGKKGSTVIAVASGVVSWASKKGGYGNLVEIDHGEGYTTRYGHNQKILVRAGDTVRQGQAIGRMGSTGHSTGPHVHFEVLLDQKKINPHKYIKRIRKKSS